MKAFKYLLFFVLFFFGGFVLLGLAVYAVYYVYTNHKRKVIFAFKKYPEIESAIRKIASVASIELNENKLSNVATDLKSPKKVKQMSGKLNLRQKEILKLLSDNNKLDMSDIKKNFSKITVRTLRRDLVSLERMGLIVKSGKTKGSVYSVH